MKKANFYIIGIVGLTTISIIEGYQFYYRHFGMTEALLLCVVFETIRLLCIQAYIFSPKIKKIIVIPLYITIVTLCGLANSGSFFSEMIESNQKETKEKKLIIERAMNEIKRKYVKLYDNKEAKLLEKINICNIRIAQGGGTYWQKRLVQRSKELAVVDSLRDIMVSQIPSDPINWVKYHATITGVDIPDIIDTDTPVSIATSELMRMSPTKSKRILSIFIVVVIELGIIMLTILSPSYYIDNKTPKPTDITDTELEEWERRYVINGRVPPANEVSGRQRELRKLYIQRNN